MRKGRKSLLVAISAGCGWLSEVCIISQWTGKENWAPFCRTIYYVMNHSVLLGGWGVLIEGCSTFRTHFGMMLLVYMNVDHDNSTATQRRNLRYHASLYYNICEVCVMTDDPNYCQFLYIPGIC